MFGYREDDAWVALALEMDLRGYGRTFKQAMEELRDLVNMQVSFALFKNQPEMIWRSAEPVWFSRYEEARKELLQARLRRRPAKSPDTEVAAMPIPPDDVVESIKSGFRPADA